MRAPPDEGSRSPYLQVPRLRGRLPPLVVAAIGEVHRRLGQILRIHVIEAGELHRDVVAADFLDVPGLERTNAAVFAEQVRALLAAEA